MFFESSDWTAPSFVVAALSRSDMGGDEASIQFLNWVVRSQNATGAVRYSADRTFPDSECCRPCAIGLLLACLLDPAALPGPESVAGGARSSTGRPVPGNDPRRRECVSALRPYRPAR